MKILNNSMIEPRYFVPSDEILELEISKGKEFVDSSQVRGLVFLLVFGDGLGDGDVGLEWDCEEEEIFLEEEEGFEEREWQGEVRGGQEGEGFLELVGGELGEE